MAYEQWEEVADRLGAAGLAKGLGRIRVIYGRDFQSCLQGMEGERLGLLEGWGELGAKSSMVWRWGPQDYGVLF